MNRLLKIAIILLSLWCLLLVVVATVTQTQRFRDWLRDRLQQEFRQATTGELIIERIEGNLVTRFRLQALRIDLRDETLLACQEIAVSLSLARLLQRRVLVRELIFETPVVTLLQRPDSSWNYAQLIKSTPPETHESPADWQLDFLKIGIRDGQLLFHPLDSALAVLGNEMHSIQADFMLSFETLESRLQLEQLRWQAMIAPAPLTVRGGSISLSSDTLRLKEVQVEFADSQIMISDGHLELDSLAFQTTLAVRIPQLQELQPLWPSLNAQGRLLINGEVSGSHNLLNARVQGEYDSSEFTLNGFVRDWSSEINYMLDANVRRLDLHGLFPNDTLRSWLNFTAAVRGQGLTPETMTAQLHFELDSSRYASYQIDNAMVEAKVAGNRVRCNIAGRSAIGNLEGQMVIADIAAQRNYALQASVGNLNLAAATGDSSLQSDLSFTVRGAGESFHPETFDLTGTLALRPSSLQTARIDTAAAQFRLAGKTLRLDTIYVRSEFASVEAAGSLSAVAENDLHWRAKLGDLELIRDWRALDTLEARGAVTGLVGGTLDSLLVGGAFELDSVQYNNLNIRHVTGRFDFRRTPEEMLTDFSARGWEALMNVISADSLLATGVYREPYTEVDLKLWQSPGIDGFARGRYWPNDTSRFVVQRARLNILHEVWEPMADSLVIRFIDDDFFFDDFNLFSGRHRAFIDGKVSTSGSEDLQFGIENLELATLSELAGRKGTLRGQVDLEVGLSGTAPAPTVSGHFLLRNAKIADFRLNYWAGEFGYTGEKASWEFVLAQDSARVLTGAGALPLRFTLNDSPLVVYDDRPLRIQAATTGLDLAFLQTFTQQLADVKGTLDFDVRLENTLAQPQAQGVVRVHDGAFSLPEYGTQYNDFRFVLAVNPDLIHLTSLNLLSKEGKLGAQGKIYLNRGSITAIEDGKITASNFALANNSEMDLKVDSDILLSGAADELNYRGSLTVNRSQFFVDELQSRSAILQLMPDSARLAGQQSGSPWQYDTRVNGNITIDLARNTRLVGPDFSFEIGGRLQFVQENEEFSIFGNIQILRGSYQILGKRLEVQSGQINLQGDLETSPQIDVTARHRFRQSGQGGSARRTLFVKITEEMYNPTIAFYLDNLDSPIEEKEALSYLLFNAPSEEIGFVLTQQTGAAAGLAVGGLLSSQLTSSLGEALNLDVIEFYGGQQLAESSVMVGKYLTSDPFDIFISYTQDFSSTESLNGSKVALELELNRPLWFPFTKKEIAIPIIIQAAKGGENDRETGFDLIWKLEW